MSHRFSNPAKLNRYKRALTSSTFQKLLHLWDDSIVTPKYRGFTFALAKSHGYSHKMAEQLRTFEDKICFIRCFAFVYHISMELPGPTMRSAWNDWSLLLLQISVHAYAVNYLSSEFLSASGVNKTWIGPG